MVASLNSTVQATELGYSTVQTLRKRITYLNNGVAVTVGKLPPGAIVVGGGFQSLTTFNGSGTDLLDIGTSADPDEFATALVISATAPIYIALDELATNNSYSETAETTVTATYTDQNSDATTGAGDVVIMFITKYPLS